MSLRILDKKALRAKGVPYSNVHLLRLETQGKFPKRFNLTQNRVAWIEDDVDRWIKERVKASTRDSASSAVPALAGGADATTA
jgi:prophage regulatory protein